MKRIILALALFAAPFVHAADAEPRACPFAPGVLGDNLTHRVVYTQRAGFVAGRYQAGDITEVAITLKHALPTAWTCATWEVELLLPDGVIAKSGTTTKRTGLIHGSVVEFEVEIVDKHDEANGGPLHTVMQDDEAHEYRGAFAVRVFNDNDAALTVEGVTDGIGRVYYPVVFHLANKQN